MNAAQHSLLKKIGLGAWAVGLAVLLVPFLFIGESWGMLWMYVAAPLSFLAEKKIGLGRESYLLIGAVSVLSSAWWALVLYFLSAAAAFALRKKAPNPSEPTATNSPPSTTPLAPSAHL